MGLLPSAPVRKAGARAAGWAVGAGRSRAAGACGWSAGLNCDWREKPPGKGYEATGGRKGWAEEQAWKGREHLCQFCFLAPHFTRDADRLVWVQQEEQGAQGKAAGAWEPER